MVATWPNRAMIKKNGDCSMPNQKLGRNIIHLLLLLAMVMTIDVGRVVQAQEESIHPGINRNFENPNVDAWLARFERDDRVVYTRRDEVVATLNLKPGMDVADIGAGTGFFTMLFAREVGPDGTVYAADIASNFVEHIMTTAAELGLNNVKGVVNPVDSTNLEKDSVDVVFMAHTYHHFEYPFKMLDSIRNALRPDGVVVLVDMERVEGVSPKFVLKMVRAGKGTFTDEFRNAGFDLIEDVPFSEKDYILKFKQR
jgi:ubiquinone/menaquinone biosynthesis C-methylase UbiE